jgi:hypothetical protein
VTKTSRNLILISLLTLEAVALVLLEFGALQRRGRLETNT